MLTIIILYFLARGIYSATQTATIGEHAPAFYDIERARLNRIISEYSTQIPKTCSQIRYNVSMLERFKKPRYSPNPSIPKETLDDLAAKIDTLVTTFNKQQWEMNLTKDNIHEINNACQTNRASAVTDFAYEMAYKNPVARIPAMVSFLAKRMTRTK